ncbi:DNA topoisomerase 1 [Fulvia fulva]|uniref:DNA topoisomerase I n=1 Tax=Passalora fulva TaxID=5499 RepID=A0A9Q8LCH1_PASFU|nr:DNA topoisomerase 1 [Fulvia fulva]KAK4629157.1 DNA topoisomerase 1 [Fulvia fulva]KAK4630272.1 DNA topoisomerase 1 [Fulvia fulva]UJO14945.1 DNA topoisomerase 1 [Fulvia fulva]WPV12679.1 DNA topoisomerase 1 [Fulvia fulva]WPV27417.1 DNA topoisomerase 1 [Fulvia fulva]
MSDSEDDRPLVAKSKETISKAVDAAMDKQNGETNGAALPGISIANGPVEDMDVDKPTSNGKRKASMTNGNSYKEASESDDEDDVPLKKRKTAATSDDSDDDVPLVKKTQKPIQVTAAQIGEDSGDEPIVKKLQKEKAMIEKKAEKEAKEIRADESKSKRKSKKPVSDDEDDEPIAKKTASTKKQTNGAKRIKKEESDEDDKPLAKKKAPAKKAAAKKEEATPKKGKGKVKKEESPEEDGEEEEEYRWWEDPSKGDGTTKWNTLEHNGVVFPPEYEPLPKNVKLLYDGVPVSMHPGAEEIAHAFGAMLNSTHNVENPTFQKNFMHDFKEKLEETGHAKDPQGKQVKITKFEKCDFKPIFNHVDAERQAKKALPAAEKKKLKAEKDEIEAPYLYCMWDGRKQKVGNFRVEPPGLFRGRGEHPKTGKWKKRVLPEQITINIGKEATVPKPPEGHQWKEIKHDNTATWLAMWQENINGAYKYVMLAANSDIKGQSDYKKFEKARELKKHIDRIRKDYTKELKSEIMAERQRATAVYLIDQFALRAGNEKSDDEADTVGCCSLKFENVTLKPPNKIIFDFLGKDSIRFYDEVEVSEQVFKNLKIFKRSPKKEGDEIFDRLTTSGLNKHLSNYMQGLTAKVFRTYNASYTMSTLLQQMTPDHSGKTAIAEQVKAYNDANRKVAILCNHKRTVAAGHAQQMEKMEDKINALRYQQYRVKLMMLDLDPKQKKKRGAEYFELPEGLDKEWQETHHKALVEEQRTKIQKKFDKENEKLEADGDKPMKAKELEERMEPVKELEAKLKKEFKTGKVEAEGKSASIEKYEKDLEKLDTRIATMQTQAEDRDNNKEVALGTSKINYIDPRLTVVFSKKFDVPIERFFSKTLREKFDWAIKSVDEDWEF